MTHYGIMQHPVYTQNEFQVKLMNDFRTIGEPMARINQFDQIEYNLGRDCWTPDKKYFFRQVEPFFKSVLPKIEPPIPFERELCLHPLIPKVQFDYPPYPKKEYKYDLLNSSRWEK